MKNIILIITAIILTGSVFAQGIKPGIPSVFHAKDENGQPISHELVRVEVSFVKKDADGNMIPIYTEEFTEQTTLDGTFKREIGQTHGDLPDVTLGKYSDINFKEPGLCVRVSFRRIEQFNPPWIIGEYERFTPVPVANEVVNTNDGDQDDQNELQEIVKVGDEVKLSHDGGTVVLNDDDPTNELQILSFDENSKTLTLEGGNTVDLSGLSQFTENGSQLSAQKTVQASQFTTTNGQTDIEEGKISLRYANGNGSDGIEMGVDNETCTPFITFIDCEGNILGEFRMGPDGFKFYSN